MDGVDYTDKIRKHKFHSILFANIPSFGSGTHSINLKALQLNFLFKAIIKSLPNILKNLGTRPWSNSKGEQRIDDGRIEVMGLTTYTLPRLQAGMSGFCLGQCSRAKIKTTKTIPMQVDGEASRLNPATIELKFLNQVVMMTKQKGELFRYFKKYTISKNYK